LGVSTASIGAEVQGLASQQEQMPSGGAGRFRRLEVALQREERILSGEDESVASDTGRIVDEHA